MPDIGLFELILIGAIAFLVLGPERLPDFFAQIGRVVHKGRNWMSAVKQQLDTETKDLRASGEEVRDAIEHVSTIPDERDKRDASEEKK